MDAPVTERRPTRSPSDLLTQQLAFLTPNRLMPDTHPVQRQLFSDKFNDKHAYLAVTLHHKRHKIITGKSAMLEIQPDPLWDEGIASYLSGEYEKRQVPLTTEDLQLFARDRAVRIGDLLETLFLMAIYGEWQYVDANGVEQTLDEDALNELYAKGRISEGDLVAFDGLWKPA